MGRGRPAAEQRGRIYNALTDDYGYSRERGLVIAKYLKGRASFEEACDAV